jgi:hypothetical protein
MSLDMRRPFFSINGLPRNPGAREDAEPLGKKLQEKSDVAQ